MKFARVWIAFLMLIQLAHADELFSDDKLVPHPAPPAALSVRSPVLSGQFELSRTFAGMSGALRSEGNFILSNELGLLWEQSAPFPSSLLLTAEKMSQRIASGPTTVILASDNPVPFAIMEIFLGLFQGDFDTLTENFRVYFEQDEKSWQIGLQPTSTLIERAISTVTASGHLDIEQLVITDKSGNIQSFRFNGAEHASELTEEQLRKFQW
jgi:hypothetical protein